jgi:hypothetical protein
LSSFFLSKEVQVCFIVKKSVNIIMGEDQ